MKKKKIGFICRIIVIFILFFMLPHILSPRLVLRFAILSDACFYSPVYFEIYQDKTIYIAHGNRREDNNLDAENYFIEGPYNWIDRGKLSREQYKYV